MSMAGVGHQPRIILQTSIKTYDVPIYDLAGNPAPINLTPLDPFDQVSVVGDTAKALDRRVDRVIPSDQTGGAGRKKYEETEGVTDFRQSDADTRFKGAIVCRPKRVSLGGLPAAFGPERTRVFYTGFAGASIHAFSPINKDLAYYSGAAWLATSLGLAGTVLCVTKHSNSLFAGSGTFVYRSDDGINFNATPQCAVNFGIWGLGSHDGKLWAVTSDDVGTGKLFASTNPNDTGGPGAVVWTLVATFPMDVEEDRFQVFSWKDASGTPTLFFAAQRRLYAYNPVGGTVEEYDDYSHNIATFTAGSIAAQVFRSTGDLFITQGVDTDYLMRYSPGSGFGKDTPNRHGGLSQDFQGQPVALAQNSYGLGVWLSPFSTAGASATGGAWFRDAAGGWHLLYRDLTTNWDIYGGGMGNGKFWTVLSNRDVQQQDLPATGALPQFATGRKYDINIDHVHEYARTDFGTEGTRFALLGFDLHTIKSDGTDKPGLDANTSVKVEYNMNGNGWVQVTDFKNTSGVITPLAGGVVTGGQVGIGFPVRLVTPTEFGVVGYDLAWRVTLRTTNEDNTPVVVYCAPRGKKTPPPHYAYEFVVDATDFLNQSSMAGGGVLGVPFARTAGGLHQVLEELDQLSNMVKITYGLGGQRRTDLCEFAMAPQLHPQAGVGRYRISLRSVDTDPSG